MCASSATRRADSPAQRRKRSADLLPAVTVAMRSGAWSSAWAGGDGGQTCCCVSCAPSAELSLADSCLVCGRRPPRFLFFAISGSLCNIAQLALDRALLAMLPDDVWWIPTVCWTLSYTLSVSLRHASHAYFVFGQHSDPACIALGKTYLTYMSTIVASTAINLALIGGTSIKSDAALILTASFSVVWSYFALKYTWKGPPPAQYTCLPGCHTASFEAAEDGSGTMLDVCGSACTPVVSPMRASAAASTSSGGSPPRGGSPRCACSGVGAGAVLRSDDGRSASAAAAAGGGRRGQGGSGDGGTSCALPTSPALHSTPSDGGRPASSAPRHQCPPPCIHAPVGRLGSVSSAPPSGGLLGRLAEWAGVGGACGGVAADASRSALLRGDGSTTEGEDEEGGVDGDWDSCDSYRPVSQGRP